MSRMLFSPLLFVIVIVFFPTTRTEAAGLEGVWRWSYTDQGGTEHERLLKVRREEGKFSAVVVRDQGSEAPAKDLAVEGDRLSFTNEVTRDGQVRVIKYEGKLEGDLIRGKIEVNGQTRDWEAKRQAPANDRGEGWIELMKGKTIAESG